MNSHERVPGHSHETPPNTLDIKRHLPLTIEDMFSVRDDLYGILKDLETRTILPEIVSARYSGYCDNKGTSIDVRTSSHKDTLQSGEIWFQAINPDTSHKETTVFCYRPPSEPDQEYFEWSESVIAADRKAQTRLLTSDDLVNRLGEFIKPGSSRTISRLADSIYNSAPSILETLSDLAQELELQIEKTNSYTYTDSVQDIDGSDFTRRHIELRQHIIDDIRRGVELRLASNILSPSEGLPLEDTTQSLAFAYIEEDDKDDRGIATIGVQTTNPTVSPELINDWLRGSIHPGQSSYHKDTLISAAKELSHWQLSELWLD